VKSLSYIHNFAIMRDDTEKNVNFRFDLYVTNSNGKGPGRQARRLLHEILSGQRLFGAGHDQGGPATVAPGVDAADRCRRPRPRDFLDVAVPALPAG
jgi:hypothetical protein